MAGPDQHVPGPGTTGDTQCAYKFGTFNHAGRIVIDIYRPACCGIYQSAAFPFFQEVTTLYRLGRPARSSPDYTRVISPAGGS